MKDIIPVILTTSVLAIGSVCFYMYRLSSKDMEVNSENEEHDTKIKTNNKNDNYKNDNDRNDNDINDNDRNDNYRNKNDRVKTKRNKKSYGTKRRFS
jgi:hypothetical protein